ncbi:alpha-galactosidase [Pararcticibacter amylolyticus]|uniref:Alpha-galactosidase n=2 Tax=Pararcticibacter amylolyticus TaxID=2173175 RepID=A0A2U2PFX0_9SPHI|nr:alpha-galactosidase [Pararcticibacter amylolyticus]
MGFSQVLPVWNDSLNNVVQNDWLVKPVDVKSGVFKSADGRDLILYNGLVKRTFRITPNLACTDYRNLRTGRQLIRAVSEEARIRINGKEYAVGGLHGQKEKAYLMKDWAGHFTAGAGDFCYTGYSVKPVEPFIKWDSSRFWAMNRTGGRGTAVSFFFSPEDDALRGLQVTVKYELYDGIPLIVKSVSLVNRGKRVLKIERLVSEVLAMAEEESAIGKDGPITTPKGLYIESNYAFNNAMSYPYSDQTTHWTTDSTYTSQVSYWLKNPCKLEVYPAEVTGIDMLPGDTLNSVRTHELLMDGYDREMRGLAVRKMYRVVAPWVTANPIFMHLVSRNDEQVMTAIDQCAATGYEALIISFGSHLRMEDTSRVNLQRWKAIADYAHGKGIRIGCYSLFSSRSISPEDDVIDPKTGKPNAHAFFEKAPCFGSRWGLWYRDNIKNFFIKTGFDIWENDGPYPGDLCASTTHPGHKNVDDSQWRQMNIQKELYHWLNERGVYINSPDWYFLDGSHKIAMGYKEVNFKLPRENQKILNRQNIFDGTWEKTPSMGWGFVPLTEYGGGGPESVIEPLSEHLKDYEQLMVQYYGAGIQACYRGPRLYDTEETKQMVASVISWYKKYRQILNSDIIHLRRADGRDWDGFLHVNPSLKEKGLIMMFNPTKEKVERTVKIPLYYSGLSETASVREKEGRPVVYKLNRDYTIDLTFTLEAEGYTWFVME